MASATAVKGVKISDFNLISPRVQKSNRDTKFQVKIKFSDGAKTETSVATEKESLASNAGRVIWNESFSFVGDTTGSVVTFKVYRTQLLSRRLIGSLTKNVTDLLQSVNDIEICVLDMNGESGQLSFKIELRPAVLSDIVCEASTSSVRISTGDRLAKIAGIIFSVHDTFVNQEKLWSSFLSQFRIFMNALDKIAEIHPYLQLAWCVLSIIPKTIITCGNRNDSVKQLCEKLGEVYDFITSAKRLPRLDKTPTNVLSLLVRQTIECAYFIREYSKENPVERIWKGSSNDDKITSFVGKFSHLKKVITDSVTLDTGIITLRVSKTANEIRNLHLLDDMPYARNAGFISKKRCLPGTRQKLINEILEWVNSDSSEQILVLNGQAGTGKSAVAHTIAEVFQKQNRLGSMFCFNRIYRDRISHLFSTITRDLADGDVLWRRSLAEILDKTAIRRSIDPVTQFEELIVKPSNASTTVGPVVIVIDALDESGDWTEREPLLDILFGQVPALPNNYRFILTTRPEQDIESRCQDPNVLCKRMGDIPEDETLSDIENYISSRLKRIGGVLDEIQKDWSAVLAKRSEGLFQWAETACRAMDSLYHRPSLKEVWEACTSGPSASLYDLYHNIISTQRESEYDLFMKDFKLIIGAIITAREPLTMDALEGIFAQDVKAVLRPFGSLLLGVHDPSIPVRPLHTSLLDFFQTRNRDAKNENEYYVNTSDQSLFSLGCLKLMNGMLRFNICSLETSHVRNRDVRNFAERLEKAIPLHLSYACRFWAFHLRNSGERTELVLPQLRTLMGEKILYLFEALGLLKEVEKGRVGMAIMRNWCKGKDSELADQAGDAWRLGFDFGDVIEESTPHLYLSALPFTPSGSFISKQFLPRYPHLLNIEVGQQVRSPPKTGLMKKNCSYATSLAFSPQGKYIATGFQSGEFWFWDGESGEILYQGKAAKRGPSWKDPIHSIVFSPDGQLIYLLGDVDIRIFDVKTMETCEDSCYDIPVGKRRECTVSSDGCHIAFGIEGDSIDGYMMDYTLMLCDRNSHRELARSYAKFPFNPVFSPDGDMLAFCGQSAKIHLWDIRERALVHSWKLSSYGHFLALSNRHIAFQSYSGIEVWDVHTLSRVCKFHLDGSMLDMIIHYQICFVGDQHILFHSETAYSIGDVSTGESLIKYSPGDRISSIAASPDSKHIALSMRDGTIHVGPSDTPIEPKKSDILDGNDLIGLWLRGRNLVQLHRLPGQRTLLVSDITIPNSIVFQVRLLSKFTAVSPRHEHVSMAYVTTRGLCIWSDSEGECVLDESTVYTTPVEYSPLGDRIISYDQCDVIKIWDVDSRALIGSPYTVPGHICSLAFSVTGESFVVAYESAEPKVTFIEIRECQSGRLLHGAFKSVQPRWNITLFADETKIIRRAKWGIELLNVLTGEIEIFDRGYMSSYVLSPNGKYLGYRKESGLVGLWDINNRVELKELPSNDFIHHFRFSDDSARIVMLFPVEGHYYVDIWDMSNEGDTATRKASRTRISLTSSPQLLTLNGNYLVFSDGHIANILDLDFHRIVWTLYEHHKNHSQFGMFPIDEMGTRKLSSNDEDVLEYALTAWDKALFSMASEISEDGWVLAPHGELLFWVPEGRRRTLWRPCLTYTSAKDVTKLDFNRFVHGCRWTECREKLS